MQGGEKGTVGIEMIDKGGVGREGGMNFGTNANARFVGPEPGYVTSRVAAAAEDEERQVEGLGVSDASTVGLDVEVEAP